MLTPASATAPDTIFNSIPTESTDYEAGLAVVGEFDTVEEFCRYHLFKSGIKPMWEDEANANGGKWVLTMKDNPVLLSSAASLGFFKEGRGGAEVSVCMTTCERLQRELKD